MLSDRRRPRWRERESGERERERRTHTLSGLSLSSLECASVSSTADIKYLPTGEYRLS